MRNLLAHDAVGQNLRGADQRPTFLIVEMWVCSESWKRNKVTDRSSTLLFFLKNDTWPAPSLSSSRSNKPGHNTANHTSLAQPTIVNTRTVDANPVKELTLRGLLEPTRVLEFLCRSWNKSLRGKKVLLWSDKITVEPRCLEQHPRQ